jgi:high-affinity nickel permease
MKNETDALNEAIIVLQNKRANELTLLKEHLSTSFESLKPINLLKNTLMEVDASPEMKSNFLTIIIGIATGFLTRKLLAGSEHRPVKRIIGTIILFVIAKIVSNHADEIASIDNFLYRLLQKRKESRSISQRQLK